ncbi:hypothetical protein LINPERHAP1_LOCUS25887 [Linum perenne]
MLSPSQETICFQPWLQPKQISLSYSHGFFNIRT